MRRRPAAEPGEERHRGVTVARGVQLAGGGGDGGTPGAHPDDVRGGVLVRRSDATGPSAGGGGCRIGRQGDRGPSGRGRDDAARAGRRGLRGRAPARDRGPRADRRRRSSIPARWSSRGDPSSPSCSPGMRSGDGRRTVRAHERGDLRRVGGVARPPDPGAASPSVVPSPGPGPAGADPLACVGGGRSRCARRRGRIGSSFLAGRRRARRSAPSLPGATPSDHGEAGPVAGR